jgi:ribonuclease T1
MARVLGVTLSRRTLRSAAVFVITLALAIAVTLWNERDPGGATAQDPVAPSSSSGQTSVPSASSPTVTPTATPSRTPVSSPTAPASSNADAIRTGDYDDESGLDWIVEADLPPEGRDTLALIDSDGPYPFDRDGITFENREGILPDEGYGYYAEFTVIDPNSFDRGPLRIVAGSGGEFYYTADHYDSFWRIYRG